MKIFLLYILFCLAVSGLDMPELCTGCNKQFNSLKNHEASCKGLLSFLGTGIKRRVQAQKDDREEKKRRLAQEKADTEEKQRLEQEARSCEEVRLFFYLMFVATLLTFVL